MSVRRGVVAAALFVLAALSVAVAPASRASVLPPPPALPAPPAGGNPLADILGPSTGTVCNAVATVYALAGPIAAAQLPKELQPLVTETDPYTALITYACGLVATPPSTTVCAADSGLSAPLGGLGLPVSPPAAAAIFYDTAAGIEHAFLRLGVDVGQDVSEQLATALGCGEAPPASAGPPAARPTVPTASSPGGGLSSGGGSFASNAFTAPTIPGVVAPSTGARTTTIVPGTAGRLGAVHYPVREEAALLLALPLALSAGGVALGPRLRRPRRRRRGTAPWLGSSS